MSDDANGVPDGPQWQLDRANDIAAQIALTEMVRMLISEFLYHPDRDTFRRRLATFEKETAGALAIRKPFPQADDTTNAYIQSAASGFVSKIVASILHSDD